MGTVLYGAKTVVAQYATASTALPAVSSKLPLLTILLHDELGEWMFSVTKVLLCQ